MTTTKPRMPAGLDRGGRELWRSITEVHELDAGQRVILLEAARAKDRLDKLDSVIRGDATTWIELVEPIGQGDGGPLVVVVNSALDKANNTANLLKQLLAALRLPDVQSGKRPQARGGARGAYAATPAGPARISSLDRARQAASS